MKIVTCIKQVRDLDIILSKDWVVDEDSKSVNIDYANTIINTYDENALEMMLRLSDYDNNIETIALTIGDNNRDKILRKALAVKTDNAIRIEYDKELNFHPIETATMIKKGIEKIEDVQMVMCGRQASIGDNGQTGLILAEMLGWPCISLVTDIVGKDDKILVTHQVENGLETLEVKLPVVLTVTQSPDKFLRMATIKDVISAKKKDIFVWNLSDLDIQEDDLFKSNGFKLKRIYTNEQDKECKIIEGQTSEQKARQFCDELTKYEQEIKAYENK
ncbi:electron transfer flavoprotein subunit beta/FixA family protein [Oceanirhabdus seepicola]|uniref:Electron transfer flavoprotein subunit beta/FixA family protein n=1 Tax=Oceanirhabdus seepicola TaxID=2828781 RepID=A0A9J6NYV6_9CLOT|nr:electron transfer flavoprotein subunit beta/FixA family protein [Oceanirhabdus seepicola]MCM1988328.1 electron transfer flavoprotein subunit beta/FixA family protein [Oceanirhabdus seepicola]